MQERELAFPLTMKAKGFRRFYEQPRSKGMTMDNRRYIVYHSRHMPKTIARADVLLRFPDIVMLRGTENQKVVLMPENLVEPVRAETGWQVEEDLQVRPLAAGS